jgi:hypothetical protein
MKRITRMRSLVLLLFAGLMSSAMAVNTVSVEATVSGATTTTDYETLQAAFDAIGTTAGTYTVTINSSGTQTMTSRLLVAASQTVTLNVASGINAVIKSDISKNKATTAPFVVGGTAASFTADGTNGSLTFDGDNYAYSTASFISFSSTGTNSNNLKNVTIQNVSCKLLNSNSVPANAPLLIKSSTVNCDNVHFINCKTSDAEYGAAVFARGTSHIKIDHVITFTDCTGDVLVDVTKSGTTIQNGSVQASENFSTDNRIKVRLTDETGTSSSASTTTFERKVINSNGYMDFSNVAIEYIYDVTNQAYCYKYDALKKGTGATANDFYTTSGTSFIMTSAGWGTLMLPEETTIPDGLKAWTCSSVTSGKLNLTEQTSSFAANTPYIVSGTEGFYNFPTTATLSTDVKTAGYLSGVFASTSAPEGSYVLQNQSEGVKFYKVSASDPVTVKPFHCYLTVSGSAAKSYSFDDNTTTAITSAVKVAAPNTSVYSISGVRIKANVKSGNALEGLPAGFYIVDGKKYIVK